MRKFLNVLGILFAVVFSILLVALCVVLPLFTAARSFLTPAQLTRVVTHTMASLADDIPAALAVALPRSPRLAADAPAVPEATGVDSRDILRNLLESEELRSVFNGLLPEELQSADGEPLPAEAVDYMQSMMSSLSRSPTVNEILNTYAEDLVAGAMGEMTERRFTSEYLRSTIENNLDELVDLFSGLAPAGTEIDRGAIRDAIQTLAEESADELVSALPSSDDLNLEVDGVDVSAWLRFFRSPILLIGLIVVTLLVAGLVYACRFPRFKGFLWVGIDAGIAALILVLVCILLRPVLSGLLTGGAALAVLSVVDLFLVSLWIGTAIVAAAAALFIVLFVLLRKKFVTAPAA